MDAADDAATPQLAGPDPLTAIRIDRMHVRRLLAGQQQRPAGECARKHRRRAKIHVGPHGIGAVGVVQGGDVAGRRVGVVGRELTHPGDFAGLGAHGKQRIASARRGMREILPGAEIQLATLRIVSGRGPHRCPAGAVLLHKKEVTPSLLGRLPDGGQIPERGARRQVECREPPTGDATPVQRVHRQRHLHG